MTAPQYTREDYESFEKLCAPWHVNERVKPSTFPLSGNGFLLRDLIKARGPADYDRETREALANIWTELGSNLYYKWLIGNPHYCRARESFERKIRKIEDENEKSKKRLSFAYTSGMSIYIGGIFTRPIRLTPDKRTAVRILTHINGLLDEMNNENEYAHWADYKLRSLLEALKSKLGESKTVRKVGNSFSPEHYFVFRAAQVFITVFKEPMPAVLGDLCQVLNYSPDDTTITRWVAEAEQDLKDKDSA